MSFDDPAVADRERGGLLVAASVLTGVLGAATIYSTRAYLGLEAFAPLAQLWTMWALLSASLTFGVQHRVARALVRTGSIAGVRRRVALVTVGVAAVVATLSYLFAESWFDGDNRYAVMAGLLVVGTGVNGVARGVTAAAESPKPLATVIVGENAIRLMLLVPLVALGAGPAAFAGALIAGFAVGVAGFRETGVARPAQIVPDHDGGGMVTIAVLGLVSFALVTAGPMLLAPAGETSTAVSALFLVITLARIPYVVALGLLPRLSVLLEFLVRRNDIGAIRRLVNRVGVAALFGSLVTGITAVALADATFGRLFGTTGVLEGSTYALVGASSVLALGGLVMSMAFVSTSATKLLIAIWSAPTVAVVGSLALGWLNSVERLAWLLLGVESWLLAVLWWQFLRRSGRAVSSTGDADA